MESTKKLDNIIEYFKIELNLLNEGYKRSAEERRFIFNIFILAISVFVGVNTTITQIFPQVVTILLLVALSILCISIFHFIYYDHKEVKQYFDKKISLEIILKFLLHLKLTKIDEKDLQGLILRIKLDFRDYRIHNITNRKDYRKFEEDRLKEYLQEIDKINSKIVKRENEKNNLPNHIFQK